MMPLDKQAHFLAGYTIAITIGLYSPIMGLIAATVAGALKEAYDYYHPESHTYDGMDFVATAGGGLVAFLVIVGVGA